MDCSLYYLALRKKPVLVGLWRMATWSREQAATQRLLSNNFTEERWKTAALKNAYALMGRRRFEYAAAFFLLADHLHDAVNILHNQLGDTQLAIAVARVYEGDDGPVLRTFLTEKVLPQAAREGNRWLATWAFWMLTKRDHAVRALVTPLGTLLSPPETPNFQSKSYLTDDPALVILYKQLREKSLLTLRGATMVGMREEWEFVIHTAELLGRMGCDLLALDLGMLSCLLSPCYLRANIQSTVKTWEFLRPTPQQLFPSQGPLTPAIPGSPRLPKIPSAKSTDFDFDPRKLLRRRSSLVIDDLSTREKIREMMTTGNVQDRVAEVKAAMEMGKAKEEKKEPEKKPPPTQFQEPDANSLLDAFGF